MLDRGGALTILSWNVYLGADHVPLVGTTRETAPAVMAALWRGVMRTHFPTRARSLAKVIAREAPDVLALQEAYRWSVDGRRAHGGVAAPLVVHDFVAVLVAELAALGAFYAVAARGFGLDAQLATADGFDVRFDDSVAILVRQPGARAIAWSSPRAGGFARNLVVPIAGEPLVLARPWASVDVSLGGPPIRIVATHVEYKPEDVQLAQCDELIAGPLAPPAAVIAGDFNADGQRTAAWQRFAAAGFTDAFVEAGAGPGETWWTDHDLRRSPLALEQRLDWILHRGLGRARAARVVGTDPADRTDGMWPSDHFGVLATLEVTT